MGAGQYVSDELTHFVGRSLPDDQARYDLFLGIVRSGWLRKQSRDSRSWFAANSDLRKVSVVYFTRVSEVSNWNFMGIGQNDRLGRLFQEYRSGNRDAIGQLVECFYPELRCLAASRMQREREDHTWQPTVLIHELYMELTRAKPSPGFLADDEKAAFFGLAGHLT